jgi:ribosomal protein L29
MNKNYEEMTTDELKAELKRQQENLCDLQDTHSFTFGRTSVHIGAEQAQNMQLEYEEECRLYDAQIARIRAVLRERGND